MAGSGILFFTIHPITKKIIYCIQYVHSRGWLWTVKSNYRYRVY